ncbi:MAG: hypothetical protein ACYC3B_09505 [Sedimentisphaerales bacterium]
MKNVFVIFAVIMCTKIAFGIKYEVTDIGVLNETYVPYNQSQAAAINNSGDVACSSMGIFERYTVPRFKPCLWTSESGLMKIPARDYETYATGINDIGQVIGGGSGIGYIWSESEGFRELGALGDQILKYSNPTAINNRGQVVGQSDGQAFIWSSSTGIAAIGMEFAWDINNEGYVVGYSGDGSTRQACLWNSQTGHRRDLGTFGWSTSEAYAINDSGDIVGVVSSSTGQYRGFVLQNDGDLFILNNSALAINNLGQVVGNNGGQKFIWTEQDGVQDITLLDGPSSGWNLNGASIRGINDLGQIVGYGINPEGYLHGFILTPVPEPTCVALLFLGVLVLRKRRTL